MSTFAQNLIDDVYQAELQADDMMLSEFRDNARAAVVTVLRELAADFQREDRQIYSKDVIVDRLTDLANEAEATE